MSTLEQWLTTWRSLDVEDSNELRRLYRELVACYSEAQRHYHTLQHLRECFARLEEIRALAQHPAEVELALWFHDAIYDARSSDNESKSAAWARDSALAAGLANDAAQRIHALIMATRHALEPAGADEQVLVDVDLSILGADSGRFDEYERQVRQEYHWVPEPVFRVRRKELLQEFLDRPAIFSTQPFIERYEQKARTNLRRSLQRLGA